MLDDSLPPVVPSAPLGARFRWLIDFSHIIFMHYNALLGKVQYMTHDLKPHKCSVLHPTADQLVAVQESIESLSNAVDRLRTSIVPSGPSQADLHTLSRKLTKQLASAADDPGIESQAQAQAARRWQVSGK